MDNQENNMRPMMSSNYGDQKYNKSTELNSGMSIKGGSNDELTNKLQGGLN